jgi:hypothetical protein
MVPTARLLVLAIHLSTAGLRRVPASGWSVLAAF